LVHSMMPDSAIASCVFKAGGNGYLSKVSDTEEIEYALKRIAAGKRYVSPQFAEEMVSQMSGEAPAALHETLSEREYQVMCVFAAGRTPFQIAEEIGCSVNTISTYRHRILKKLGLKTSMDIVRYALQRNLVNL